MKISSNFAPPLRIISPFFITGVLFYILSIVGLFTLESHIVWLNLHWIGFVHTYLIGFVMLIIVGAMAQLLPVVLERGHCCVGFYPIIFTFISLGTLLLLMGFLAYPLLLSYGGLIIVLGFAIFGIELILTGRYRTWVDSWGEGRLYPVSDHRKVDLRNPNTDFIGLRGRKKLKGQLPTFFLDLSKNRDKYLPSIKNASSILGARVLEIRSKFSNGKCEHASSPYNLFSMRIKIVEEDFNKRSLNKKK